MRLDHLLSKESKVSVLCIVFHKIQQRRNVCKTDVFYVQEAQDFSFSARRAKANEAEHT